MLKYYINTPIMESIKQTKKHNITRNSAILILEQEQILSLNVNHWIIVD